MILVPKGAVRNLVSTVLQDSHKPCKRRLDFSTSHPVNQIGKKKKRKLLTDMHTMVGNYVIGLLPN